MLGPIRDANLGPAGKAVEERRDFLKLKDVVGTGFRDGTKVDAKFALQKSNAINEER